ncbi:hypothetical protein ADL19_14950 [Streptomyces purpurogeneiscleroticus]|nr:hypothetical protein ADL19_14950 [Streptomyces purpurogeneiscleroticus]
MRLNYGISVAEFEAMFDLQDGKCKICHGGPKGLHSTLVVDHDHETGAVRGLLCGSCNALLGMAGDDIEILDRARRYLNHQDIHA